MILAAYNNLVDLLNEQGMTFPAALAQVAKEHKLNQSQRLALVKYHDDRDNKLKPTVFEMPAESSIVPVASPTDNLGPEAESKLELGQWYWVHEDRVKKPGKKWLGCITHIGSNYVEMTGTNDGSSRIHFNEFDVDCEKANDAQQYIETRVQTAKDTVATLMNEIKQLTAGLGIVPTESAPTPSIDGGSTALAVANGIADIKAHKAALIKAKEKTLPGLFKQVQEAHATMALWMKADLLPLKASLKEMQRSVSSIDDRIFTVELYAGLTEELVQIKEGKPAPLNTKVSLFQRRHYMDEECLYNYQAGGMEFENIKAFDKWLLHQDNFKRILPYERCIVAFQVRRERKERSGSTLGDFIVIMNKEEADKSTFLYMRNGEQAFRLSTEIDFGAQLFPDKDKSTLLGAEKLYMKTFAASIDKIITWREYEGRKEDHKKAKAEHAAKKAAHVVAMKAWKAWKAAGSPVGPNEADRKEPYFHDWFSDNFEADRWVPCTPESVYYDDAMRTIAKTAMEHNRVAIVLQGLLDRSPALHPHPPWKLWTGDGFVAAIELIYDDSRALVAGPAINFEAYRKQLNKSIKVGSMTLGQHRAWMQAEAVKEGARRDRRGGYGSRHNERDLEFFSPYGNPGPGVLAKVVRKGKTKCSFSWERERQGIKWVSNPNKPGYQMADEARLLTHFACDTARLFNVSAYTPGDYKMFFADPRTRAEYLKWAPYLLTAEDWAAGKKSKASGRTGIDEIVGEDDEDEEEATELEVIEDDSDPIHLNTDHAPDDDDEDEDEDEDDDDD